MGDVLRVFEHPKKACFKKIARNLTDRKQGFNNRNYNIEVLIVVSLPL